MKHTTEDQLILHAYGESDDPRVERHLADCSACRAELDDLRRVLAAVGDAPVPERSEAYPAEVWRRIQPRLPARRPRTAPASWRAWFTPPRLTLAASMALLTVIAFVAGRHTAPPARPLTPEIRERVLLVAVGDHLERSRRLLIELANTPGGARFDLAGTQAAAHELVRDNRLYRRSATHTGDRMVVDVLDELERLLLEISNGPTQLEGADLIELRRRIERRGILTKIRVIGGEARRAALPPAPDV